MIKRGDRVRISDRGAEVFNIGLHRGQFDWHNRRGCLHHLRMYKTTPGREIAYVLWDGRRSLNWVPLEYLEPEEHAP